MVVTRDYVVIVRCPHKPQCVLAIQDHRLPRSLITLERRPQHRLIGSLKQRFGANRISLSQARPGIVVVEILEPAWTPNVDFMWLPVEELTAEDRAIVEEPLPEGFFTTGGWLEAIEDWVRSQLDRRGLALTGRYDQYFATAGAALIRFETTGRAVWMKAANGAFAPEIPISIILSTHYRSVPEVIAVKSEWNAILMWEAAGRPLDEFDPASPEGIDAWRRAAAAMAALQESSAGDEAELLNSGCADWRPETSLQKLNGFLAHGKEAMHRQPPGGPLALSDSQVDEVGDAVRALLTRMGRERVPNTIMHGDLNHTNIIVGPEDVTFLDWAEGWVSHPGYGYEYLAEHYSRLCPGVPNPIRDSYLAAWRGEFADAVEACLEITPQLALLTYAMSVAQPRNRGSDGTNQDRGIRSYLRRLHRELIPVHREVSA